MTDDEAQKRAAQEAETDRYEQTELRKVIDERVREDMAHYRAEAVATTIVLLIFVAAVVVLVRILLIIR